MVGVSFIPKTYFEVFNEHKLDEKKGNSYLEPSPPRQTFLGVVSNVERHAVLCDTDYAPQQMAPEATALPRRNLLSKIGPL